jgi:hypothetical protein
MQATMKPGRIRDAQNRLTLSPPCATGLSRRSPRVALKGHVRMNAAQNGIVCEIFVQK